MEREEERQRQAKKSKEAEKDKETFNEAMEAIRRMKGKYIKFANFIWFFIDFNPLD